MALPLAATMGIGLIDNAVNLGLTLASPKPVKRQELALQRYNNRLNIQPQLDTITNQYGNLSKSLAGTGIGAGAQASVMSAQNASKIQDKNKLYSAAENYRNRVDNMNVELSNTETRYNQQSEDLYQEQIRQQKVDKLSAISGNIAEGIGGVTKNIGDYMDYETELERIGMYERVYGEQGIADRFNGVETDTPVAEVLTAGEGGAPREVSIADDNAFNTVANSMSLLPPTSIDPAGAFTPNTSSVLSRLNIDPANPWEGINDLIKSGRMANLDPSEQKMLMDILMTQK